MAAPRPSEQALKLSGWHLADVLPLDTPLGKAERRVALERAEAIDQALEEIREEVHYWERLAEAWRQRVALMEHDLASMREALHAATLRVEAAESELRERSR
jgi:hypothetical protein